MEMTLKVGPKGQIVIPKFVRDGLGIVEKGKVLLSVTEKTVVLMPVQGKEVLKAWEEQAQQSNVNVSKNWIYGDRLYEEEF